METITKENEKTILGKNRSNRAFLFAELMYNSGVKYFDNTLSELSKDVKKSKIEIGQYEEGITIKIIIGWKGYSIAINKNEIEKIEIINCEHTLSQLSIYLTEGHIVIMSFKNSDKTSIVGFLEKFTEKKIVVLKARKTKKAITELVEELVETINNRRYAKSKKDKAKNELNNLGYKLVQIENKYLQVAYDLYSSKTQKDEIVKTLTDKGLTSLEANSIIPAVINMKKSKPKSIITFIIGCIFIIWVIYLMLTKTVFEFEEISFGAGLLIASGIGSIILSLRIYYKKVSSIVIYTAKKKD